MIDLSAMSANSRQKRYLIGIPFFLLVVLVSPLLLILAPVMFIACLVVRVNPFDAARLLWNVLAALRGAHVEFAQRDHSVLLHIS